MNHILPCSSLKTIIVNCHNFLYRCHKWVAITFAYHDGWTKSGTEKKEAKILHIAIEVECVKWACILRSYRGKNDTYPTKSITKKCFCFYFCQQEGEKLLPISMRESNCLHYCHITKAIWLCNNSRYFALGDFPSIICVYL